MPTRPHFRLSVQAKVQLPVLGVLVLLTGVTVWLVERYLTHQMEDEAWRTLTSAESVFLKSLDNRALDNLARYRVLADVASVRVTAELADVKTIDELLGRLLGDLPENHAALFFYNEKGELLARRGRMMSSDLAGLSRAAEPVVRRCLEGESGVLRVAEDRMAYAVQGVPVTTINGRLVGVLAGALRIDEATVREMKLPRTEIMLVAGGRAVLSTLSDAVAPDLVSGTARAEDGRRSVIVEGQHFLAHGGRLGSLGGVAEGNPAQGLVFVVLSSYEERLQELERARAILLVAGAVAMLAGAVLSWFLIRRVTRPLLALRNSAEAIGRGDFTRRIERFSDDEVGDLSVAFNQMAASLQTSRAELERAMQTLRATQTQLIQSEKLSAVGQFVAGVAHELNNPLTSVVGFSEMLQDAATDDKMRGHLDRIARSAHRCHKIVQSLLSFARQHPPERKLIRLNELADGVLELMAYELRTSNITVVKEYATDLPPTMADPHQLEQVFVNILGNARQAIEPYQREGRIVVRTRAAGDRVTIEFEDNGPGIRPEHLARIFDPFFTTKPVGKGTGLGLSLVYGIVQEHGGKISARSEPGSGATFCIELPVGRAPVAVLFRTGDTPAPFANQPGTSGKTVLVIDDEEWILELAAELLRGEGHAVETAQGGERALELLTKRKFDLIVSDWKMPGLNGVRLYEHLCAIDPAAAAHVLFMTGDVVNDTFQNFLQINRLPCLSKPFAIGEFRAAVARLASDLK